MFSSNTSQVSQDADYIEDVFSTWLYTGNGSTQTITNGIDLAGEGGLVWNKSRSNAYSHSLIDTVRGAGIPLFSNATSAQQTSGYTNSVTGFISTGFTLGADSQGLVNNNGFTYASWTFRKQPKFFDVVTYTGTGTQQSISHNLGATPGFIVTKTTSESGAWRVWTNALTVNEYLTLNTADAKATYSGIWGTVAPNATQFQVGTSVDNNISGATYVAYLFAHDAGGFGLTGTDNVISCGSFTTDGSGQATVNLGYEPQWVLIKSTNIEAPWWMLDTMRGWDESSDDRFFRANSSVAEDVGQFGAPTSTGFFATQFGASNTFIYIAIRRGPMKVPTDGTSVFSPVVSSAVTGSSLTTNFPVDLQILRATGLANDTVAVDRLRGTRTVPSDGNARYLLTNTTGAETNTSGGARGWNNTGFQMPSGYSGITTIFWNFRRAPNFFDEVCDVGTGSAHTVNHNLTVVPELMLRKGRSGATQWEVYSAAISNTKKLVLNSTLGEATDTTAWNSTTPTSSVFTVGTGANVNTAGATYVTYLFATCPGVSKVGSYTGTGTTQQINCNFSSGARFVLIKRTDASSDGWYVWDSARGLVSGSDPYLLLNSTAAEVVFWDYVDTYSAGFEVTSGAPSGLNANGGSYIFLAIA